jgi:hypothetical protein
MMLGASAVIVWPTAAGELPAFHCFKVLVSLAAALLAQSVAVLLRLCCMTCCCVARYVACCLAF